MKPKTFTVVGSTGGPTFSRVFIPDKYNNPANIGIGVVVSGVHVIVDIQHTFADWTNQNLNTLVSAAWINNSTLVSATQANNPNGATDTNYAFYPNAIRMRVRAMASAGSNERATVTFIQAGPED